MNTWEKIREKAIEIGFKPNALDQWKFRGKVPKHAQIRIFKASNGAISFEQMSSLQSPINNTQKKGE